MGRPSPRARTARLLTLIALLVPGVTGCFDSSDHDGAPARASSTSPASGPRRSETARDEGLQAPAALRPFARTSPWRLPVALTARFAPVSDPRHISLWDVGAPGQVWANHESYSHPIAMASSTDPVATVTDAYHSLEDVPPGGSWHQRIPVDARIAAGTDAHMHVIDPRRRRVSEHFATRRLSDTSYSTTRRHVVDLLGSGIGPQNGTRAYGGSAIGGLIRGWEVDPTHRFYTGRIRHPLAMALRPDQLYYAGHDLPQDGHGATFNASGYGLAQGYVWPATEQDGASPWTYTGEVPMGSYLAIPGDVGLDSLGLKSSASMMVAQAAQDYGVYVTDAAGAATFYVEDDNSPVTAAWRDGLVGPNRTGDDLRRIIRSLRVVVNNTPSTPNGGGLSTSRRVSSR